VNATPDAARTFALIMTSITMEALPFVLVGAVASSLLGRMLTPRIVTRIGRLPLALQIPVSALSGAGVPLCECASVPVAKRLIQRGIHPAAAVSFMLAAPVLNPIVLFTTALAYSGQGMALKMVAARAFVGLATAIVVALGVARGDSGHSFLRASQHDDHDHGHDGRTGMIDHIVRDFTLMGKLIVVGASLAALFQVVVPERLADSFLGIPMLASLLMMLLAFALSLCSEGDAFVAASFTNVPYSAQLAFLTFGPIADFKLALLYGGTFRRDVAWKILVIGAEMVLLGSFAFWTAQLW
jgi:uncharacterized membrane protein YraQ (UPF0718 family)